MPSHPTTSAAAQYPARSPDASDTSPPPAGGRLPANLPPVRVPAPGPGPAADVTVVSTAEALRENWERVKEHLRREFGDLTEDDLRFPATQEDLLVDRIVQKTGRAPAEIRAILDADARRAQP